MELVKGQRLQERFKVVASLFAGRTGRRLLAKDGAKNDALVMLSVLPDQGAPSTDQRRHFEERIGKIRTINSDLMVLPIEYVDEGSFRAIVSVPFEADDIESYISARELGHVESLELLEPVLAALELLHNNQLFVGTFSSGDILVASDGAVKISAVGLPAGYFKVGIAHFFSPEFLREGECTAAADIYAFGAVCFQLLNRWGSTPGAMRGFIAKATQYEPAARYRNIHELRSDFGRSLRKMRFFEEQRANFYIALISLYMLLFLCFLYFFTKLVSNL